MRRQSHRFALVTTIVGAVLALVAAIGPLAPAGAQTVTTTTAPPATTTPTTVAPTQPPGTTAGGATTETTAEPSPPTTAAPATDASGDSGDDIPWVPIAIGVAVLALLVLLVALLARRRGAARQGRADWRHRAADTTAEAGATARLLSQGTPPSGQIAQQLLTSLRAFEDLEESAPSDTEAATAERARRALQTLGLAIDSDYRLRRTGGADAEQLARSAESVQRAAAESDRTLRGVYRSLTSAD